MTADQKLLATLVAELPDAVSVHDAEGICLYASPAFVTLCGWEPEQLVGHDPYLLFHPEDVADIQVAHVATLEGAGRAASVQYRLRCADGSYRWVETTGRRIHNEQIVAVTRWIADRRSLLQALDNERLIAERLREVERERQIFLTSIAHRARHPMTVVVGYAKLLQAGRIADDDRRQQIYDRLAANADELAELIEVATTADELSRRSRELRRRPVDLAGLVRDLAADFWDVDRAETTVTVDLRGPALVFADRERLTVALRALFHNAVKHTPVGTDVWIRVGDHPDGRLLIVEDNGPGVPDLLKTAIFDRLAHGLPDQDHPDPGLGLGLYLVDQIARAHNGRAWVQDRVGGGASFRVLLPSARAH